jgi:hypothetical protein
MPLRADDITAAFAALAEELERDAQQAEIVIVGGAALVLLFGARESTKDVDACFVKPEAAVVRDAAARVAQRRDLPADWLNDAAKGYMHGVTSGAVVFSSPSLVVRAASVAQLLAMKLAAWRDAIDRDDAKLLLTHMSGSPQEIWAAIEPLIPSNYVDKASYAFEDLLETIR